MSMFSITSLSNSLSDCAPAVIKRTLVPVCSPPDVKQSLLISSAFAFFGRVTPPVSWSAVTITRVPGCFSAQLKTVLTVLSKLCISFKAPSISKSASSMSMLLPSIIRKNPLSLSKSSRAFSDIVASDGVFSPNIP